MSRGRGHHGPQNGTTLHQSPQIPGSGGFLPRFLPEEAAQQKLVIALAGQAIAQLAKISLHLTQQQLAALVTAYKQGVAARQAHGWLTAALADTLDSLASTVQA